MLTENWLGLVNQSSLEWFKPRIQIAKLVIQKIKLIYGN